MLAVTVMFEPQTSNAALSKTNIDQNKCCLLYIIISRTNNSQLSCIILRHRPGEAWIPFRSRVAQPTPTQYVRKSEHATTYCHHSCRFLLWFMIMFVKMFPFSAIVSVRSSLDPGKRKCPASAIFKAGVAVERWHASTGHFPCLLKQA